MHTTPNEVLRGQAPELTKSAATDALEGLPTEQELEALRQQRIRFDGFFTGQTW